jgi:putative pyruvate formate lyase activating enzyme
MVMKMKCKLCPRLCNKSRIDESSVGYCKMTNTIFVSKIAPHFWEEPVISGENGTAAVFFTGCSLDCIYCQNSEISQQNQGIPMTINEIVEKLNILIDKGCHSVSFVTPTHYSHKVVEIIKALQPKVPVVYNTSGYERIDTLKSLENYIDIYLPDFKYCNNALAKELSNAPDYFDVVVKALKEMVRQTGSPKINSNGIMTNGTIVRNLVLPNYTANSIKIIEYLSENYSDKILFSLMAQYTPHGKALNHPKLNRKITRREYNKVLAKLENSSLDGFCQDLTSANDKYIPKWDI